MDNSGSSKEQVSCTYQKVDGYLALPAYLGTEGWMVNLHLLPGSQHPQKEFTFFIRETLGRVRQFCKKRLLLRIDSAHDALDNQFELLRHDKLDWIIKWNPRKQDLAAWATASIISADSFFERPVLAWIRSAMSALVMLSPYFAIYFSIILWLLHLLFLKMAAIFLVVMDLEYQRDI